MPPRAWLFILWGAGALTVASGPTASAAQIFVEAPDGCVDPATLTEEVSDLIGQPLASIADADFRIQISARAPRAWRLRLETLDPRAGPDGTPPAVRGTREIDGASCAELVEAASVAIAVSVRSIAGEAPPPQPPPPSPGPPPAPTAALSTASTATKSTPPPRSAWHAAVALAVASDTGALPSAGLGVDLEAHLGRGPLRLVVLGTWFGSQDTVGAGDNGGTFQLLLGGGLVCWGPPWGRWTPLACGGLELGRLAGTGLRVTRPETGAALWRAGRADLGVTGALGGNASLLLRAGLVIPWARPEFVLDESQLVYRPSRLGGRLTAGLEVTF